jgi:hypothetical protein
MTTKNQAVIKPKTLELMAKELGNLFTGTELIDFLTECGIDRNAIEYSQTKWRMVYDVFLKLATSDSYEDKAVLLKIIGEAVHPLMHNGDTASAESLLNKFNDLLSYENGRITYDEEENTYKVYFVPTKKAQAEIMAEFDEELAEEERKQQEFLCQPENKERIFLLKKAYQLLMGVVSVFCEKPSNPTVELNDNFQYLFKLINKTINELGLLQVDTSPFSRNEHFFYLPFSNLFAAEKVYREQGGELSWEKIRPEMNAMYGDIEELYQEVSGSDVLAEPDKQDKLNKIQLSLSVLKKKREIARKVVSGRRNKVQTAVPIQKIEIVKGKMEVEGLAKGLEAIATKNEDNTITKNRKVIRLPHFQSTPWHDITIRFLDERNVLIQGGTKTVTADYEALGFSDDKSKKPNLAWVFLFEMATNNGETKKISSPIPDNIKQIKRQISDFFKKLFKNDTEPFSDFSETNTYKLKIKLIPPQTEEAPVEDPLGLKSYLDETMTSEYETPKSDDEW